MYNNCYTNKYNDISKKSIKYGFIKNNLVSLVKIKIMENQIINNIYNCINSGGKIFLTSDLHLGHQNIIKYCNRPFKDTYLMNNTIIDNHNSVVTDKDICLNMGDFAFGGIKKYTPYLNGKIILIRGNHDRNSDIKDCGLEIVQNLDIEYGGYKFKMNHRPVFLPNTPDPFNDAERRSNIHLNNYDWIICGHVHQQWKVKQKNINVGVDVWDFKPVAFDDIIELIKTI